MTGSQIAWVTYGVLSRLGKAAACLACISTPVAAEEVTVLALGDSLTQGFGLPEADGFVPQMQRWLDARGVDATLINAGVSGDTTAGGAARIGWSLTPEVDAMILNLGANDMLRGLDPAQARDNIETILQVARDEGVDVLLIRVPAANNYGAEYKQEFDSLYPELSQEYDTLYAENFFAAFGSNDLSDVRQFFQADGIHPNAEGVAAIVEDLGPRVQELVSVSEVAE